MSRPPARRAAAIMRSTSSAVRYSRLRLASFGWRTGGCFLRFAQDECLCKEMQKSVKPWVWQLQKCIACQF